MIREKKSDLYGIAKYHLLNVSINRMIDFVQIHSIQIAYK